MKNIRQILAERIKEHRKILDISQETLAEKCKITHGALARIETKRIWPSPETAQKIAEALGIEQAQLYQDPETKAAPSSPTIEILVETVAKLSARIKELEAQLKAQRRAVGETIAMDRIKALEVDAEAWRSIPEPLRPALAVFSALNQEQSGAVIQDVLAILSSLDGESDNQKRNKAR